MFYCRYQSRKHQECTPDHDFSSKFPYEMLQNILYLFSEAFSCLTYRYLSEKVAHNWKSSHISSLHSDGVQLKMIRTGISEKCITEKNKNNFSDMIHFIDKVNMPLTLKCLMTHTNKILHHHYIFNSEKKNHFTT